VPVKSRFVLLTKHLETGVSVDVPPVGPSPGDSEIWVSDLLDSKGRLVGSAHHECTSRVAYRSNDPEILEASCSIAFVLGNVAGKRAQLFAEGHYTPSRSFAVTGTGGFRYARGQVTLGKRTDLKGREFWTFDLKVT
jgi:hypothetical protein